MALYLNLLPIENNVTCFGSLRYENQGHRSALESNLQQRLLTPGRPQNKTAQS